MATVNGISPAELNRKLTAGAALSNVEFGQALANFKSQIEMTLPVHLKKNADKYMRQARTLFSLNPALQECNGLTILNALMTATGLGLDLTPALGQAYIIPYDNRKKINGSWVSVKEASFQLGFRGMLALAQRSGEIRRIAAEVVCEKDYFKYTKGLNAVLEHTESEDEDRGKITHAYALAEFKNGGYVFDVWPVSKIIAHAKKFSKSYFKRDYKTGAQVENDKSPWHTHFEAMAKKTLIAAIWKYMPLSPEVMIAAEHDESVKTNINYSNMQDERDIITVAQYEPDEEQEEAGAIAPQVQQENTEAIKAEIMETDLKDKLNELLSGGGLDLTEPEKTEFLFRTVKRKDINALTADELRAAIAEAEKAIQAKDGKGR